MVHLEHPAIDGPWARLITNHAHALRVEVHCPRGAFTPTMIERVGIDPKIRHMHARHDQVQFWVSRLDDCNPEALRNLIKGALDGLKQRQSTATEEKESA